MSSQNVTGVYILTDPDQERNLYYKLGKTSNVTSTITQLNMARANRDVRLIKFFPCNDINKIYELLHSAMKKRYIVGSADWIKLADDADALSKLISKVETLVDIVNNE